MSAPEIVTFGEAMGLFLADAGTPLAHARRFTRTLAGAELNTAVALARLGHAVAFAGRVGDDPFGDDVRATLRAEGVDAGALRVDPSAPTGLLTRDQHGERRLRVVYHRAGAAGSRLTAGDLAALPIEQARALHVTGITPALGPTARAATLAAVERARAAGVPVSFDPNFRARLWSAEEAAKVLRPLALAADLVLAGEEEACWLSGCDDAAAAATWFLRRGARAVAVKRGARGAWVADGERALAIAARPVALPVDPVGAGDAFDAGFLSAWLREQPLERCGAVAAAVGAACVQSAGDLAGLPTGAELAALLDDETEVDR
ncbi:sugar kinase [Conexibacter arvalis]|uniref:2-dehydro-3-deoxygluconokinase n=1 Tax=Conexibacter arvalis TaxID=912552 RepID=A0A840ICZ8_9ACTN|nr:sugar kinase [Conexibacter arvalis]MBB4662817.1 2-dehydro-3-deoxygluconokinase [Conexibacter arvalis]